MTSPDQKSNEVNTDNRKAKKFDINEIIANMDGQPFNDVLASVNDSVLRLGVFQGEFEFHVHENEDELFYIVEGELFLDVEDETHALSSGQGFVVPKGAKHRTRTPHRAVVLMIADAGLTPAKPGN